MDRTRGRMTALVGFLASFSAGLQAVPVVRPPADANVVFVVVDGIRDLELKGKAVDDQGRKVSAQSLFPNLLELKRRSLYFENGTISNPYGISLPAYADLFAGRRQEHIRNNRPDPKDHRSRYPTIFHVVKQGLGLGPDGVGVFSMWEPICGITRTGEKGAADRFFRSCGWQKGKYLRPAVCDGCRTDLDTFAEFARELPKRQPRLSFVLLGEADEEAHQHKELKEHAGLYYGIHFYHQALRDSDYYVRRIWDLIQATSGYRDKTYLVVTTDHGRDDDNGQWWDHGECKSCEAYKKVFAMITGPGIRPAVVREPFTHADVAPTIAALFGLSMETAAGKPMVRVERPASP